MIRIPCARIAFRIILVASGVLACVLSRSAEPAKRADREQDPGISARNDLFAKLGVNSWQAAGIRGQGVKVAILDTGFRGYRDQLGKALPRLVTARSFRFDHDLEARDSNHGVMCAEIIHAIAPDAELLFANWEPDHAATFVQAVAWSRSQGAKIISCSVITPAWSDGEGGGAVHAELAKLLGTGGRAEDALAFACAGNLAQRHWSGTFHDDGKGRHIWKPNQTENELTPWGDERVSVEMCWRPGAAYALEVVDGKTRKPVGSALRYSAADRQTMVIRFDPKPGHAYSVHVNLTTGKPGSFHVSALASWLGMHSMEGSIPFPGDGREWLAVGAVDTDGRRLAYSSCGPNLSGPKPDLVATVPFPTSCRSWSFSGTSAAAPQAAGLAALLRSRYPDWSAEKVRALLCRTCVDLGPPGHDAETGFGQIALPALRP